MCTPVPNPTDGESPSTLHYFCLKLHHFTFRMTPIDTHFFIPIPSKKRICKTLSNFSSKLATFQFLPAAKGLIILYLFLKKCYIGFTKKGIVARHCFKRYSSQSRTYCLVCRCNLTSQRGETLYRPLILERH